MDVADARARGHARLEHGIGTELAEQLGKIDRLAAGMRLAVRGGGVRTGFRIAERAAPGRLEGDLDAVAVEVPEIDGFGDQMIGRRDAHVALQGADGELRQVGALRHVDGDVVEAGGARHDWARGTGFEHDQDLAADAEA